MADVEFLPERGEDAAGERSGYFERRQRASHRARAVVAGLALVAVAAGVVAAHGGSDSRPPAARPSSSPTASPSATRSTLVLPESVAFGPQAEDVLADGARVYSLTPTMIGMAERNSPTVTVRPTPIGLSNQAGTARIVPDLTHRIIWAVSIGATAISAYDTDHLDPLVNTQSPYPINDAVAMDEKLYFTTDHGLWSAEAGPGAPEQNTLSTRFGAITANPATHQILVATRHSPSRLRVLTPYGGELREQLPVERAESLAVAGDRIWLTGSGGGHAALFSLDASTFKTVSASPASAALGRHAEIVADYGNELLVRSTPSNSLFCTDATTGALKQRWTAPPGAATLNERGVLITTSAGLEPLNARDCLAG